ncbi:MAG: hypothetical protein K2G18_06585, partial [Bacteroidales bacterium]|nr:hypothetical protein [Bacteroidales bacterium]
YQGVIGIRPLLCIGILKPLIFSDFLIIAAYRFRGSDYQEMVDLQSIAKHGFWHDAVEQWR